MGNVEAHNPQHTKPRPTNRDFTTHIHFRVDKHTAATSLEKPNNDEPLYLLTV